MGGSYDSLAVVAALAFLAPLAADALPGRVPSAVLEILAGIAVGPQLLGLAETDAAVEVLAVLGLAFLLFTAGLEVDLRGLGGGTARAAIAGFGASAVLALAAGGALTGLGLADDATFVAVTLAATSLGIVVPVLRDSGVAGEPFGQLVIAAATVADFATVILLTLLFSSEAAGTGTQLALLGAFAVATAVVVLAIMEAGRSRWLSATLLRLQDSTAQIRVRGAIVLLAGFAALATHLGLEVILGTFVAGALLAALDRDGGMTHPLFRAKLDGAAYGVFVPVFFVTVGLRFDLDALTNDAAALATVPVAFAALLVVRAVPALRYRDIPLRRRLAAGALQATSLPFIVAATMIGTEAGVVGPATAAGLVGAGLLSVIVLPPLAARLLATSAVTPGASGGR